MGCDSADMEGDEEQGRDEVKGGHILPKWSHV